MRSYMIVLTRSAPLDLLAQVSGLKDDAEADGAAQPRPGGSRSEEEESDKMVAPPEKGFHSCRTPTT